MNFRIEYSIRPKKIFVPAIIYNMGKRYCEEVIRGNCYPQNIADGFNRKNWPVKLQNYNTMMNQQVPAEIIGIVNSKVNNYLLVQATEYRGCYMLFDHCDLDYDESLLSNTSMPIYEISKL